MLSVFLCHAYIYCIQLCVVNIWLFVVCVVLLCLYTFKLYSCVMDTFCVVCVLLICLYVLYTAMWCQPVILCCLSVFIRLICTLCKLCAANFWFYFVWGILSRIYLLYTAVWCQSLIAFCLCRFVMSICIQYSCVLSTFDCMLYVCCCMFICIQYNCVLSTFLCVFLLICNLYNEFYALMLIIILYNISLVLNYLLKPIQCVNNESASIPYVHDIYLETRIQRLTAHSCIEYI